MAKLFGCDLGSFGGGGGIYCGWEKRADGASKVALGVACVEYNLWKNTPGDSRERNHTGGSNVIFVKWGIKV